MAHITFLSAVEIHIMRRLCGKWGEIQSFTFTATGSWLEVHAFPCGVWLD
jgi:hypothetical protein